MKLIEDWKSLHKKWSVQAAAAAATVQGTWLTLPEFVKSHLPSQAETVVAWVVTLLLVAIPILRGITQDAVEKVEDATK